MDDVELRFVVGKHDADAAESVGNTKKRRGSVSGLVGDVPEGRTASSARVSVSEDVEALGLSAGADGEVCSSLLELGGVFVPEVAVAAAGSGGEADVVVGGDGGLADGPEGEAGFFVGDEKRRLEAMLVNGNGTVDEQVVTTRDEEEADAD